MANREEYNTCMRPYISGKGKPKEQRRSDFCIGAKICSGKAGTREEAVQLCNITATKATQQASVPENNPCASVIEMATWVQQPSGDGVCRPCLLAPVTQWYIDALKTGGRDDLVAALEGAVDVDEVALAAKLDEVKAEVPPELRARLRDFDCHAQLYRGEQDGS
jgi:hypothetical protein